MSDETLIEQLADEDEEQRPDLGSLVEKAIRTASGEMRCCMPGVSGTVSTSAGTVAARPALRKDGANQEAEVPDCPVMELRTSLASLHLPMAAGDPVLMLYTDRSTDEWAAGDGAQKTCTDPRTHDPTDAIVLPVAKGAAPVGREADAVLQCGGGELAVTEEGDVEALPAAGRVAKVGGETDYQLLGSTVHGVMTTFLGAVAVAVDLAAVKAAALAAQATLGSWLSSKAKVG